MIGDFRRLYAFRHLAGRIDGFVELLIDVELGRFFQLLAHFVELGLADHLVDAALKFPRQGARLADPVTGDAQRARQILRADENQRDDSDQQQFRPADIKQHRD